MRVAVVVFDGYQAVGGTVNSGLRVSHILNYLGVEADNVLVNTKNDIVPKVKDYSSVAYDACFGKSNATVGLSKYDFLYIVSIDPSHTYEMISGLDKPYGVICHDEADLIDPIRSEFAKLLSDDHCKFVQYIEPYSVAERHASICAPTCPEIIVPCQLDPYDEFNDSLDLSAKTLDIMYGGRMVNRKKVLYLMKMAPYLDRKVECWGHRNPGIHNVQLEAVEGFNDMYKGEYTTDNHPSKKSWYHWSCVMLGKGHNLTYHPRIERSTIEALLNYSMPILLTESVPDTFDHEYPLLVDWMGEDGIGRVKYKYDEKAEILLEHLSVTDSWSIDQRVAVIKRLYNDLFTQTDYYNNYKKIIEIIEGGC